MRVSDGPRKPGKRSNNLRQGGEGSEGGGTILPFPPHYKSMPSERKGEKTPPDLNPKLKGILDRILDEDREVFEALARVREEEPE